MRAAHVLAVASLCTALAAQVPAPATEPQSDPAMRTVTGELAQKLDSKSARAGDRVVIKTRSSVRTADGTEIPKGSLLIAHIAAAKSAESGDPNANAQIAVAFDSIELKGGQNFRVRAEIKSLAPAKESGEAAEFTGPAPTNGSAGRAAGDMYGSTPSITAPTQTRGGGGASGKDSAAGALVARSGDLIVRTSGIPGLLVAHRETGAAPAASILLGTQHDIVLESGTRIVIGLILETSSSSGGGHEASRRAR